MELEYIDEPESRKRVKNRYRNNRNSRKSKRNIKRKKVLMIKAAASCALVVVAGLIMVFTLTLRSGDISAAARVDEMAISEEEAAALENTDALPVSQTEEFVEFVDPDAEASSQMTEGEGVADPVEEPAEPEEIIVPREKVNANAKNKDENGNVIVVIDPGHGGSNCGALYLGSQERYFTMKVAQAMYDELNTYDGITVYLTHESANTTIEISDRLAFAASKNADFLFSLHFNAKNKHDGYGGEVWIPMKGEFNRKAYEFSQYELDELSALGIFDRGIKTRDGDSGDEYYGIMRYGNQNGVCSCIIEHCHLDNDNDLPYVGDDSKYAALGVADATAVAKFYGLTKKDKSVSYADVNTYSTDPDKTYAVRDKTKPTYAGIKILSMDESTHSAVLELTATDPDSVIEYYALSSDGGKTYSKYQIWDGVDASVEYCPESIKVNAVYYEGTTPAFKVIVKNKFELKLESEVVRP